MKNVRDQATLIFIFSQEGQGILKAQKAAVAVQLRSRLNLGLKVYIVFKTVSLPRVPFTVQVHISIHLTLLATEVFKQDTDLSFHSSLSFSVCEC